MRRCMWDGEEFPCFGDDTTNKTLKWTNSYTFLGACCSFNYVPDGSRSLKTESIGDQGGLTAVLTGAPEISDGKSGSLYSDGFIVRDFYLFFVHNFLKILSLAYCSLSNRFSDGCELHNAPGRESWVLYPSLCTNSWLVGWSPWIAFGPTKLLTGKRSGKKFLQTTELRRFVFYEEFLRGMWMSTLYLSIAGIWSKW